MSSDSCIGFFLGRRICIRDLCSIDGVWSLWFKWLFCSVICFWGIRLRIRICDNLRFRYGGKFCFGRGIVIEICYLGFCLVYGGWFIWFFWLSCSVLCLFGIIIRYRNCSKFVFWYGGDWCNGDLI